MVQFAVKFSKEILITRGPLENSLPQASLAPYLSPPSWPYFLAFVPPSQIVFSQPLGNCFITSSVYGPLFRYPFHLPSISISTLCLLVMTKTLIFLNFVLSKLYLRMRLLENQHQRGVVVYLLYPVIGRKAILSPCPYLERPTINLLHIFLSCWDRILFYTSPHSFKRTLGHIRNLILIDLQLTKIYSQTHLLQ